MSAEAITPLRIRLIRTHFSKDDYRALQSAEAPTFTLYLENRLTPSERISTLCQEQRFMNPISLREHGEARQDRRTSRRMRGSGGTDISETTPERARRGQKEQNNAREAKQISKCKNIFLPSRTYFNSDIEICSF